MRRTIEQIAAFNEIAKALTSTLELREVLKLVMDKVSELLRPTNWSLVLQDEKTGDLYFEVAVGTGAEKLKAIRFRPGEGIAGAVFLDGIPKRVDDVAREPTFSGRFDAASEFRTSSVLAVPLRSRGRSLGVIELVHGPGRSGFSDEDLATAKAIADFAAIAIENARNFERVQELTITDEHTGLFNARHMRALMEREVSRARRFGRPLSLVFLDIDNFKKVNDTHGHLSGSALLREIGEVLVSSIRQVDSAFRYGGDEFAVLLIETDAHGAKVVAERIRDAFESKPFLERRGLTLALTASLGIATYPDDATSVNDLLQAADEAMYRAKRSGKNAVVSAHERAPTPRP